MPARREVLAALGATTVAAAVPLRRARAAEVTLKLHHFLPPVSNAHRNMIEPWAKAVEAASEGRIAVEIYPSMQLGGRPPSLYDQVRDGVVDVVWTLPGYTPGRFRRIEVFELPFLPASAEATSQAAQRLYEEALADEFPGVRVLCVHTHGPGSFHLRDRAVRLVGDLEGLKIRAPTRVINRTLELLGAIPVGMPVPQVPEALSKGVVDGTVLPFEVTRPLKIHELVKYHTVFRGERGFYVATFLFAMNRERYESLPEDLRAVIDAHAGIDLARQFGRAMDEGEKPGIAAARERGNSFIEVAGEDLAGWIAASQPVVEEWVAGAEGFDGAALLARARELIAEYAG